jgi:hypothetical protein
MIDNDVKQIIINVSGLPGSTNDLDNTTCLSDLGISGPSCLDLAEQLNNYVNTQKPGASVESNELSSGMTVQKVIGLIKQKVS